MSIRSYLNNSFWLVLEQILRVVSGIFVAIYLARHLAPYSYGVLSYLLAIISIVIPVTRVGMDSILVRDISENIKRADSLLQAALVLMFFASLFAGVGVAIASCFFESDDNTRLLLFVLLGAVIFNSVSAVEYYFQGVLAVKYASIAKSIAMLVGVLIKFAFVKFDFGLGYFVFAYAIDYLLLACFLIVAFFIKRQRFFGGEIDFSYIKTVLPRCWPMTISSLSVVMYMKTDQIMLKTMVGAESAGVYAAAAKLNEGWLTFVYILTISALPWLSKSHTKSFEEFLAVGTEFFRYFIWSGVGVATIGWCFRNEIIEVVYGVDYKSASLVFGILIISSVFSIVNTLSTRCLTVVKKEGVIASRSLYALAINIVLNIILIPLFGAVGAAIATICSIVFSIMFFVFFNSDMLFIKEMLIHVVLLKRRRSYEKR